MHPAERKPSVHRVPSPCVEGAPWQNLHRVRFGSATRGDRFVLCRIRLLRALFRFTAERNCCPTQKATSGLRRDYYGLARVRDFGQGPSPGRNPQVEAVTAGLSSSEIRAILQDREGNIWFGTARCLDRFEKTSFTHLQTVTLRGYPALLATNDRAVWWMRTLRGLSA